MNWLKWITHTRKLLTFFRKNYEHIKSITLTLLILLSLVLTWSLWTFKPSYPSLEGARIVKKQEVDVEAELKEIVYPTQIIYHKGDDLYGVEANPLINEFNVRLNETKFTFETGPKNNRAFDPNETFLKDNKYIEVVFPVGMTQDIYKEIFSFESEISPSKPKNVDRIFLYRDRSTDSVEGYLVSYQEKKMQKIRASNNQLNPIMKDMDKWVDNGSFVPYLNFDIEERGNEGQVEVKRRFYFPQVPLNLTRYTYISTATSEDTYEMYKKALFKDPLAVKSASAPNQITYADGTAAMVINELQNRFTYTNFAGFGNRNTPSSISPLIQSMDYINTHAGWGNPYIASNLTNFNAGFWLFVKNLPVLDPDMQMSLTWYENELQEYQRSMIELDLSAASYPDILSEEITILSGKEVKKELVDQEYNLKYVQDVRIGFTMKKQNEPHVYKLEPQWFINYDTKGWQPLFKEDREEGF